jgi:transcriptional regulator with XRE-family HTH domain
MAKFQDVKQEWMKDPLVQAGVGKAEVYSQISSLMRRIREEAGLSQGEVQKAVGIAQAEVSRIENAYGGRTPGIGIMAAIGGAAGKVMMVTFLTEEQAAEVVEPQKNGDAMFKYSALLASTTVSRS